MPLDIAGRLPKIWGMRSVTGFLILLLFAPAVPASAQTREDNLKRCTSRDSSADLRIGGCTALIQAGGETTANLAIVFADRGLGYYDKKEFVKAKDDFEQSLRLNASCVLAIGGRARVLAVQKQFAEAEAQHTRAIALATADEAPFQYWMRGMTYFDDGKLAEALRDFNESIARKPDYGLAYFDRARVYSAQQDYAKAITDNTASLRLSPAEYVAYYNRGLAYSATKEYDKAIADFDALLQADPGYVDGLVERGHVYLAKKDYPKAIADFTQAMAMQPSNQEAVFSRARVYYAQKNYALSIADNTAAIALDPTDYVAYHNRGIAYMGAEDYPKAFADLDKSLSIKPDYESAFFQRARVHYALKQYDQSVEDNTRAIALNPKDIDAFYNRSLAYSHSNRAELALADIQAALALEPADNLDYLTERAAIYQRLKLFQMADSDYATLVAANATRTYVASLKALNRTMLNQTAEAVVDCDALLAASPDSHGINETCGMVYFKAGDLKKALAAFEQAQTSAGEKDAQPLYGRGIVKRKQGLPAAAQADIDKAIAIDSTIPDYFARFGITPGV